MFDTSGFQDLMPGRLLGVRGAATSAAGPIAAVLAVPLLLTLFSARRWRRWGNPPAAVAPSPMYSPPPQPYGSRPYAASTSYGMPEPASPGAAYASPGSPVGPSYAAPGSPVGYPPPLSPYSSGDDPEATTRRL
jgi:hypothetical protein